MTGDHHRHAGGGVVDPAFQHRDRCRSRWLVGSSSSSTSGSVTQARAISASRCQPPLSADSVRSRRSAGVSNMSSTTSTFQACVSRSAGRQRATDRLGHRQIEQVRRHVLLDEADAQAARAGDVADAPARLVRRGSAAAWSCRRRCRRSGRCGPLVDREIEVAEQRPRRDDADTAQMDQTHVGFSCPIRPPGRRAFMPGAVGSDRQTSEAGWQTRKRR